MKKTEITAADLIGSIIALPPIARLADGSPNLSENRRINDWLRSAGVSSFMYGGVANLFNVSLRAYGPLLDMVEGMAATDDWVVPAIGPDFGKASDQIDILRERDFPTAVLLPFSPVMQSGTATGIRRLSDRFGKPLIVFFKSSDYIGVEDAAALVNDGVLCALEYGIAPDADGKMPFLEELVQRTGDASRILDGAGEKSIPATSMYGVKAYTSGSGIIAPHLSMSILAEIRNGNRARAAQLAEIFLPFEKVRGAISPIPVLHDGVGLAGIADVGAIGPFFAGVKPGEQTEQVRDAAVALFAANEAYRLKHS